MLKVFSIALFCWSGNLSFAQDLNNGFLDSIDVVSYLGEAHFQDTIIDGERYALRINHSDHIVIFGNLNSDRVPDGKWRYTFTKPYSSTINGAFLEGKREGIWLNSCGAYRKYERGVLLVGSACTF